MNDTEFIEPFRYNSTLLAPASKSYLQRAIALASLCEESCTILNFYPSKDALAARSVAEGLGAVVQNQNDTLIIKKGDLLTDDVLINCQESGLSTRMFSPIAALYNRKTTIVGEGSLLVRPVDMVERALQQFGVKTYSNQGRLPLEIHGPLRPGEAFIDGSESSQLLTGLLIALPSLNGDSILHVENLKSIPYIQMTLDLLALFGVEVRHENFKTFYIRGNQKPSSKAYFVEGDWSGASFHLVGGAISGEVEIHGLNTSSAQADRAIVDALQACGARVTLNRGYIKVKKHHLKAFQFDATHCPDLFPPLAVLAASCSGESEIKGVNRLKHKESNRALSLQTEFAKLNIPIVLDGDIMRIRGAQVHGAVVDSNNDHRIAMACAILACQSHDTIVIKNKSAVNKSYPTFFEDLRRVMRHQ